MSASDEALKVNIYPTGNALRVILFSVCIIQFYGNIQHQNE